MDASGSPSPLYERLFRLALDAYKQDTKHPLRKVHNEVHLFATMKKAIFKLETVLKEVERLINIYQFKPLEWFMHEPGQTLRISQIIVAMTFGFKLFELYGNTI